MTIYVLIGGAWLGGWCWQRIARRLRKDGHDVYPVTLTGLGERVHVASPEVDLDTHITDVVNLIEFEDLHDVVLVGHSYGGLVVTGAADRIPERISELVYLDTAPLPDGTILIETFPPEVRRYIEEQWRSWARAGGGPCLPRKSWPASAASKGWTKITLGCCTCGPTRSRSAPTRADCGSRTPPEKRCPSSGLCAASRLPRLGRWSPAATPLFRGLAGPEWRLVELPTGHWPMFSRPDDLADLLLELPSEEPVRSDARGS
jgi:pimeloyl-ACP methyl ester carboxylesterase